MKEPATITCSHCGKETPPGAVCQHCGKETSYSQGMEVQYKDFKGTEMLDIKMTAPVRQGLEKPADNREEAKKHASHPGEKGSGRKTVIFFWAAVVIVLSGLAWYYLLKFLLKF